MSVMIMRTAARPVWPRSATLGAMALVVLGLTACQEREVILPGKREAVRSVLSTVQAEDGLQQRSQGADGPRDIRLPAQVSNADAAQNFGTQVFRTDHSLLATDLAPVWSVSIGQGDSRKYRIVADPVVSGGRVFTLDATTQVSAVSTSGDLIWQRSVLPDGADENDATGGGLAVDGDVLYVSTGLGAVTALDVATGAVIWTQRLNASSSGQPTIYQDLLYVIAGDASAWAINTSDGRVQWQVTVAESGSNVLGAPAPIIADDLAVFGFGSGVLQAVFRRGGLRRWDASLLGDRKGRALSKIGDVTGQPIEAEGVIYAGNQSGSTIAVDAKSGRRVWTVSEGSIDNILPVAGSVFLVSDRNELLRLSSEDGTRIWGKSLPNFVRDRPTKRAEVFAHYGPILAGARVLIASSDGFLRSFDPVTGGLAGTFEIPGGASTAPVVAGQTLYVVSRKGQLLAYR